MCGVDWNKISTAGTVSKTKMAANLGDKRNLVMNFERSLEADIAAQYQPLKDQRTVLRSRGNQQFEGRCG